MNYLFAISLALVMNGLFNFDFWLIAFLTVGAFDLTETVFSKLYAAEKRGTAQTGG